jgi:hypothetical protein
VVIDWLRKAFKPNTLRGQGTPDTLTLGRRGIAAPRPAREFSMQEIADMSVADYKIHRHQILRQEHWHSVLDEKKMGQWVQLPPPRRREDHAVLIATTNSQEER